MKKIIVTGGLGYIGSHTVVELIEEGFQPIILDNLSNTRIEVLDGIEAITGKRPSFFKVDLKNFDDVSSFLDENNDISGLIHFAASKAVGESVEKPIEYYQNNISTLVNLLNEFKTRGLDNFIFSSSCTVYGQADELPITENAPFKPAESPYGKTKQMGENILMDYSSAFSKKVIALRYFNPIGAHPSAKIGELPLGVPNNLIPYVTQTGAGIREKLSVFGSDYPTEDGTAIRDYIYVVDLAKAHVIALKRLLEGKNKLGYEIFNLGTGKGNSVLEVVKTFEKVTGKPLNHVLTDRRAGDITAAYADTTFANEELGWKAETKLLESLRTAWEWQKTLPK